MFAAKFICGSFWPLGLADPRGLLRGLGSNHDLGKGGKQRLALGCLCDYYVDKNATYKISEMYIFHLHRLLPQERIERSGYKGSATKGGNVDRLAANQCYLDCSDLSTRSVSIDPVEPQVRAYLTDCHVSNILFEACAPSPFRTIL